MCPVELCHQDDSQKDTPIAISIRMGWNELKGLIYLISYIYLYVYMIFVQVFTSYKRMFKRLNRIYLV